MDRHAALAVALMQTVAETRVSASMTPVNAVIRLTTVAVIPEINVFNANRVMCVWSASSMLIVQIQTHLSASRVSAVHVTKQMMPVVPEIHSVSPMMASSIVSSVVIITTV
tara:strand:+ start:433 stop:765 length:333 start_codon:yes stop_codon:yes gene_type:complete